VECLGNDGLKIRLKSLAQVERALAGLYRKCMEVFPSERTFWHHLMDQEEFHVRVLAKMYHIASERPEAFHSGRRYHDAAIETFILGIRDNIACLENDELDFEKALLLSSDIENALLEKKFHEAIISKDPEFNSLVSDIVSQTQGHRNYIRDKIEKVKQ
jgi:hypothetical protein